MEDTCIGKECYWWKKHKDKCVNFVRLSWRQENTNETCTTDDCAPKRTALMIQGILPRLIGLQQASEQSRNKSNQVLGGILSVIEMTNPEISDQLKIGE